MKTWFAMAVLMIAALASGCQALPQRGDEQIVTERVKARWDAIIAQDYRTAYGFMSPAGRSVMSYDAYEKSIKPGFHKAARVTEVRCSTPELCDVSLELEYEFSGRRMKTPFFEKWVREGSQWWYLYQK